MAKPTSSRDAALIHGTRSGLEEQVGEQLVKAGVKYKYEEVVIPYVQPTKPRKYTPDFFLSNGIIIETKGRFVTADRQKQLLVKAQYPDLDIRFVFSNPNQRIGKKSKTTYAIWATSKGFLYAKEFIPVAWLREPVNEASKALGLRLLRERQK